MRYLKGGLAGGLILIAALAGSVGKVRAEDKQSSVKQNRLPSTAAPAATPIPVTRTEITRADNWTITCQNFTAGKRSCSADLKIIQRFNGGQRAVFSWVIGRHDGKLTSAFSFPTGVLISPGVVIKIGSAAERKVGYVLCEPNHCEASTVMDDSFLKDVSSAQTTDLTIYASDGRGVKFTANIKGFDHALAEVRK